MTEPKKKHGTTCQIQDNKGAMWKEQDNGATSETR